MESGLGQKEERKGREKGRDVKVKGESTREGIEKREKGGEITNARDGERKKKGREKERELVIDIERE